MVRVILLYVVDYIVCPMENSQKINVEFNSLDDLRRLRDAIFYATHSEFLLSSWQLEQFDLIDLKLRRIISDYEQVKN